MTEHYSDSLQAMIQLRHGLQGYTQHQVCAVLLPTRNVKKIKKCLWLHPITSQTLLKGQLCSLYEDLKAHPQKFFLDISECLVQQLINCWFCLVQVWHFSISETEIPFHHKKG